MASRFRKIAITAVGVCAGTGLTAWSLSKKTDSPYQASRNDELAIENRDEHWSTLGAIGRGETEASSSSVAAQIRAAGAFAEQRRVWCADYWWWCHGSGMRPGFDNAWIKDSPGRTRRFCLGNLFPVNQVNSRRGPVSAEGDLRGKQMTLPRNFA